MCNTMEKMLIKQILLDQRAEITRLFEQDIIEREALSFAKKALGAGLAKIVVGVRRCGKSVLTHQMLKGSSYNYINFDDERLAKIDAGDLNDFLEAAKEIEADFKFLLLDEVQNASGWELFVNRLLRNGYNIILTGSNSKLLSKELATHLTGRQLSIDLYPFSFREFLAFHNAPICERDLYATEGRARIKGMLEKYISDGGFPETQKIELKEHYLRELFEKIIIKDIVMRRNVKHARDLKEMALYLFSNFASRATYHKIRNIFEVKSVHTIKNYVNYLEESYLIFEVNAFSFKQKDGIKQPRKIYCIDTGMINAVVPKISLNIGRLMENLVFLELKRRGKEIYYYSDDKSEVDFLVKDGLKVSQLIQVCYSTANMETREREIKPLVKASMKLACGDNIVLTWDTENEEIIKGVKINFIPLWKWLCMV